MVVNTCVFVISYYCSLLIFHLKIYIGGCETRGGKGQPRSGYDTSPGDEMTFSGLRYVYQSLFYRNTQ